MANLTEVDVTQDEVNVYLDGLREDGVTNMFGAGEYLEAEYDMPRKQASRMLQVWMDTFGERHPEEA